MKMWITFGKRNILWIVFAFLLIIMQVLYFYLLQIDAGDILYFAGIDLILFLLFAGASFFQYKRKAGLLKRVSEFVKEQEITMPEASDMIEEYYQDIVNNVSLDRKQVVGEAARKKQEMQEYYAMWVHQIKTPIAAMKLLLQAQKERQACESFEEDSQMVESEEKKDLAQEKNLAQKRNLEQMNFVSDIEEELFRIDEYVGMALQYQRVNSASNDLVIKKVSLDSVIRETIRKYAKQMIRKKIRIQYAGTKEEIVSDEKWLGFVLDQILSNAVKYMKEGTISINIIKQEKEICLSVRDQGIGIQKEDIPRVFEKGYTGYNGRANKYSTGIGLYLTKQMLDKLGHGISIESEVGAGTTVRITFQT